METLQCTHCSFKELKRLVHTDLSNVAVTSLFLTLTESSMHRLTAPRRQTNEQDVRAVVSCFSCPPISFTPPPPLSVCPYPSPLSPSLSVYHVDKQVRFLVLPNRILQINYSCSNYLFFVFTCTCHAMRCSLQVFPYLCVYR